MNSTRSAVRKQCEMRAGILLTSNGRFFLFLKLTVISLRLVKIADFILSVPVICSCLIPSRYESIVSESIEEMWLCILIFRDKYKHNTDSSGSGIDVLHFLKKSAEIEKKKNFYLICWLVIYRCGGYVLNDWCKV